MCALLGFIRPGMGEWLVILLVVLVIFGPRRLPELGSALGKTIKGFRKSMNENDPDEDKASSSAKKD